MERMKLINGETVVIEKVLSRNETQRVVVLCNLEEKKGIELVFDEAQIGFVPCFKERVSAQQVKLIYQDDALRKYQVERDSEQWCVEIIKKYPHAFAKFFEENARCSFNVTAERKYPEISILDLTLQTIRKDKIIDFSRKVIFSAMDTKSPDKIREIKEMLLEKVPPRIEREILKIALSPW